MIHHTDEDVILFHYVALIEIMVRFGLGLVKVLGVQSIHDIRQYADFIRSATVFMRGLLAKTFKRCRSDLPVAIA